MVDRKYSYIIIYSIYIVIIFKPLENFSEIVV